MIKEMKRFLPVLLVGCVLFTAPGCIGLLLGGAVGAGGVAFVKETLEKNVDKPLDVLHEAALDGLQEAGIFVIKDELFKHSAKIKGETDDGKGVNVDLKALTEKSSKIKIRVGLFGEEERSHEILDVILNKL